MTLAMWQCVSKNSHRQKFADRMMKAIAIALVVFFAAESGCVDERGVTENGTGADYLGITKSPTALCPDCNVILIVIDALRADHLGVYGYPLNTSPNIDALATRSTVYTDAMAHASITRPSHMALFFSQFPLQTGVVLNPLNISLGTNCLGEALAEAMKDEGYATAGVHHNSLLGDYALTRGFEQWVFIPSIYRDYKQDAARNVKEALSWLKARKHQKFFLFLHIMDPHGTPHKKMDGDYLLYEPACENEFASAAENLTGLEASKSLYDAEIKCADYNLGKFFESLEKWNLTSNTIIVLTADHGEAFLEHNNKTGHAGNVYQELIHVPLIIYVPKMPPKRVPEQVGHIDVAPTILELVGAETPDSFQGETIFANASGERVIFGNVGFSDDDGKHVTRIKEFEGRTYARKGRWKLIITESGGRTGVELFDLHDDTGETKNLAGAEPEITRELLEEIANYKKTAKACAQAG